MLCSRKELVPFSPNTDSPSSPTNGSQGQQLNLPSNVSRSLSACVSTAAATAAEPSTAPTKYVGNASTSAARSAHATRKRRHPRRNRRRRRRRAPSSPRGNECSPFEPEAVMNSCISQRGSVSDAHATCARRSSFRPRQPYARIVSMCGVRNVHVSPLSSTSGPPAILAMPSLTARRRWKSNLRNLGGPGGSQECGYDGSVSSVVVFSRTTRLSVLVVVTSGATDVRGHRTYSRKDLTCYIHD